jgi:hypothetical protein
MLPGAVINGSGPSAAGQTGPSSGVIDAAAPAGHTSVLSILVEPRGVVGVSEGASSAHLPNLGNRGQELFATPQPVVESAVLGRVSPDAGLGIVESEGDTQETTLAYGGGATGEIAGPYLGDEPGSVADVSSMPQALVSRNEPSNVVAVGFEQPAPGSMRLPDATAVTDESAAEGPVGHDWSQVIWVFLLAIGLREVWHLGLLAAEEGRHGRAGIPPG